MVCNFYTFTKRINSTARPDVPPEVYDITIKQSCSILKPVIRLLWGGTGNPCAFNYCYLPDFSRFYWINNWTYEDRQWSASLEVDVLASWYTEIGQASKYVLRSGADWDTELLDNHYAASSEMHTAFMACSLGWAASGAGGRFVLGVAGLNNTYSIGGCGYVVTDVSGLQAILNACFNQAGVLWPSSFGSGVETALAEFGECLQKSISNPFQFINSCTWLPFDPVPAGTSSFNLALGTFGTGVAVYPLTDSTYSQTIDVTAFIIPPDEMRWKYIDPFCKYELYIPPFGLIPLDGNMLEFRRTASDANVNKVRIRTDCITGQGILEVMGRVTTIGSLEYRAIAGSAGGMVGVPISLCGQTVDAYASLQAGLGTVGSLFNFAATGNVSPFFSSIGDMLSSIQPRSVGRGGGGGFAAYPQARGMFQYRYIPVEEDIIEMGRPLCQKVQLRTLPDAIIICADGDIQNVPATNEELQQIGKYLTGGFFYEY